jgi:hypothetical protein
VNAIKWCILIAVWLWTPIAFLSSNSSLYSWSALYYYLFLYRCSFFLINNSTILINRTYTS